MWSRFKALPLYTKIPLIAVVVGPVVVSIPLVGVLILLGIMDIVQFYDGLLPGEFLMTGTHVEVGFLWIILKTPQAWLFYGSLFFLLSLPVALLAYVVKKFE